MACLQHRTYFLVTGVHMETEIRNLTLSHTEIRYILVAREHQYQKVSNDQTWKLRKRSLDDPRCFSESLPGFTSQSLLNELHGQISYGHVRINRYHIEFMCLLHIASI